MRRHQILTYIAGFLALAPLVRPALAQGGGTAYRASEEGTAPGSLQDKKAIELATQSGMREAMSKILSKHLARVSIGREADWLNRLVLAHPHVIAQDGYKVLGLTKPLDSLDGDWHAQVEITVSKAVLEEAISRAKYFLSWIQTPTVAVYFEDTIMEDVTVIINAGSYPGWFYTGVVGGKRIYTQKDGQSDVAQQLREALVESHFRVLEVKHLDVLKKRKGGMLELDGEDLRAIKEIAEGDGADLFLIGNGSTFGPVAEPHMMQGKLMFNWDSDAKCQLHWTDNAELVGTIDADGKGNSNNQFKGAVTSLKNVGTALKEPFLDAIFRKWGVWAYEGRTVTMEVTGGTPEQYQQIVRAAQNLPKEMDAQVRSRKLGNGGVFTLELQTTASPWDLSGKICEEKLEGFKLETKEARTHTMRLQVKN